jgi:hypothetical protein
MEGEKRRTLILSNGPNRLGVLLFSPSIHRRTETEPASETRDFNFLMFLIFYSSDDG